MAVHADRGIRGCDDLEGTGNLQVAVEEEGDLERLERVDSGGSIAFWRARHPRWGEICLIEAPRGTWMPWATAAILDHLPHHPNILRVLECSLQQGPTDRILVEWSSGQNLHERVTEVSPLLENQVWELCRDVGEALATLQEGIEVPDGTRWPIFHGSLQPRWIMLDDAGTARVGGWMLGTLKPELPTLKETIDSLWFVPPERLMGETGDDAKADVFALGAIAYFAATAASPWPEGSPAEQAARIRAAGGSLRRDYGLSKELSHFVSTCCSSQPESRPDLLEAIGLIPLL